MDKFTKAEKRKIGERIRAARNARGLTEAQLCKMANFPTTKVLEKIEKGVVVPKGERLEMLSRVLHMDKEEVLRGKSETENMEEKKMMTTTDKTKEAHDAAANKPAASPEHEYVRANGPGLRKLREKARLSQKDIASICNTTNFNVSAWERGKQRISMANVQTLALLYKVPAEKLIKAEKPAAAKKEYFVPDGNAIKEYRTKAGLSTKDIADLCGVVRGTVEFWESGKRRISIEHARILAEYFSVSVEKLTKQDPANETALSTAKEDGKKATGSPEEAAPRPVRPKAVLQKTAAVSPTVSLCEKDEAPSRPFLLPDNPEEQFCRNILYYASEKGGAFHEEDFEKAVGCPMDFFNEALRHNYKIPLRVVLKASEYFGKSVEEVACDGTAEKIKKKIAEMEQTIRELKRKIGA